MSPLSERHLTSFQKKCLEELCSALSCRDQKLEDYRLAGERETYVLGRISGSDVEVCIYEDEATFSARNAGRMYERIDYESEDALMSIFIADIMKYLDNTIRIET